MKKWVEELQANGPKDIVLAVVGNKIDRCDEEEVDYAMVKEYATSLGAILKLVSAKEGKNIEVAHLLFRIFSIQWVRWLSRSSPRAAQQIPVARRSQTRKTRRRNLDAADLCLFYEANQAMSTFYPYRGC